MVKLHQTYHDLYKAQAKAINVGGFISLFGYFLCFIFSIYTGFFCYKGLKAADTEMQQKAIFTVIWFLYLIFFPAIITIICENVERNVSKTFYLKFNFIFETFQENHMMRLLKFISKRSGKNLESKTLTLMELIKCCPLKFSCYLFDFDLKQAFSLLEASSTYIVFLIQYDIAMGFNLS